MELQSVQKIILGSVLWIVVGWSVGCSTHAKRLAEPRRMFFSGQLEESRERLEKIAKSHKRERDVALLDLAMIDLLDGEVDQAMVRLREVRDRFEHFEQESLSEKALSIWTDDQSRSYAGEDYEKIFIYAFLSLASLLGDGVDAESYSLQLDHRQNRLRETALEKMGGTLEGGDSVIKVGGRGEAGQGYPRVVFGDYIRGVLRESGHRDYAEAASSYLRVAEAFPGQQPFLWDVQRATSGVHSARGNGVIYVFALVGRGPTKVESVEQPTSDALLVADRILSALGPYTLPPTIAPIKVSAIQVEPVSVDSVGIAVDGHRIGPTVTLASVEDLAIQTRQIQHSSDVGRAVARRVAKKASVVAAKRSMGSDGLTNLAMDLAGVAWEATESADTRCWGLLPREIQVLRVEVPAGVHELQLGPLLGGRNVGPWTRVQVDVRDGQNSYVLAAFPDRERLGKVVSSSSVNSVHELR